MKKVLLKAKTILSLLSLIMCSYGAIAQNDVMMQAFYWDVPVDATNLNGTWWDNLKNKSTTLKNAGITGIWVPSAAKGNFGIWDMPFKDYRQMVSYN